MPRQEQLQHLLEQPGRRHVLHQGGERADRRARARLDVAADLGRQPDRAQHAHRVLAVALLGLPDHADDALAQVREAAAVVQDLLGGRVVEQGIDGEVAANRVLGLTAEDVVAQDAAVLVAHLVVVLAGRAAAEGRHLDRFLAAQHVHQAEAAADDPRAPEHRLDLLGRGAGGHVEVLRLEIHQQVAHGPAHHEGGVAGLLQPQDDLARTRAQPLARDPMLLERNDLRRRPWRCGRRTPVPEACVSRGEQGVGSASPPEGTSPGRETMAMVPAGGGGRCRRHAGIIHGLRGRLRGGREGGRTGGGRWARDAAVHCRLRTSASRLLPPPPASAG